MKKLFVVRHGEAGDKEAWALSEKKSDDLRPLSKLGKTETKMTAKKLGFLFKGCDAVATSPLTRAAQTAKIIHKRSAKSANLFEIAELKPTASSTATLTRIQEMANDYDQMIIVGHEPQLSKFLSLILTGGVSHPFPMSKGAVALVEFKDDKLTAGQGKLTCMLQPSLLKKIKRK